MGGVRLNPRFTGLALLALAIVPAAAAAPDIVEPVLAVLSRDLKFSPGELSDLSRGKIVKRQLDALGPSEIAVVGAARVDVSEDVFVERVRDVVWFKTGPDVLQIGRFSDPPVASDLASLTIDKNDMDLRSCRVGDCEVRLPADAIARIQRDIDWRERDADARAAALFKEVLFDNIRAYMSGTTAGRITEYDDGPQPIRPIDEFAELLKNSPYIGKLVAELPDHLSSFPLKPVAGAQDVVYWSKEKFGFAPFITVTHLTIVPAGPRTYVVTSRDVYSSRYIDASLALTIASGSMGAREAFYLVYANRSRASALRGAMSKMRRMVAERRAKNSLEENLRLTKGRLEKP